MAQSHPSVAELLRQGQALHQQGQWAQAAASYNAVLERQPRSFDALHLLGLLQLQSGHAGEALPLLGRAARLKPADAATQTLLGVALQNTGRAEESLAHFERAAKLEPRNPEYHYNHGKALRALDHLEEAQLAYKKVLELNGNHAEASNNLSELLFRLNRHEEALIWADRTLNIRPGHAEAMSNRGAALLALGQYQESLEALNAALRTKPGLHGALSHRGSVWMCLNRFEAACTDYLDALAGKPDDPYLRWNLCLCLLMLADFRAAWPYYDARWPAVLKEVHPNFAKPLWRGEKLSGRLLVWGEQGLGDQIMFSSMLEETRARCGELRAAIAPRLQPLFRRSFPDILFCAPEEAYADLDFDAYACIGDLVTALRSNADDFLAQRKAYLQADHDRSKKLRQELLSPGRLLCGLSWYSKNESVGRQKSLSLAELSRQFAGLDASYVDLQYGDTKAERETVRASGGIDLYRVPDLDTFNDIDGLAALIEACDVVVTISNTTAHLAGALGKPVFLMLPFGKGRLWCWQAERSDALWYPNVRVFRQPAEGDWASVLAEVRAALAGFAAQSA